MIISQIEVFAIALAVAVISGMIVLRYYKTGRLVSLTGGMHANTLLCMAIGPMFYVAMPQAFETERMSQDMILKNAVLPFALFLVGYSINAYYEFKDKTIIYTRILLKKLRDFSTIQILALFLMGSIGIVASNLGINTSGLGNIFNILFIFIFPIVTLATVQLSMSSPGSWFKATAIYMIVGGYALTTPWRSMIAVFAISIVLGITLRYNVKGRVIVGLLSLCLVWYIWMFPFLQAKKYNNPNGVGELVSMFIASQSIPIGERFQEGLGFFGGRMNSVREIGYVQNGLVLGLTDMRHGESYREMILQLIPRIVWPSKPVLSLTRNYILPREIGLLGWEDPDTSAGVGLWAEQIWNFGSLGLPLFVLFIFWIFRTIDRFVLRLRLDEFFKWWIFSCLFYNSLQILSLVTFVTMAVWTILFLYLYARFFGAIFSGQDTARV